MDLKVLMCEIPQFDKLESHEIDVMAEHMEYRKVSAGTILVKEGTFGESLFYIVKGLIEIKKEALRAHSKIT